MNLKKFKKLARSDRWQFLYNKAKELNNLKLFKNDINFAKHQIQFLYYLNLYDTLYQDLASKENYITKEIIKDDLRCEAYLLYKNSEKTKKLKDTKKQVDTSQGVSIRFMRGKNNENNTTR